jgi:hypothetical protein
MDAPWLLLAILAIGIMLAVFAFVLKRKYNTEPDYYALFVMGAVWTVIGIALSNVVLGAIGLILSVIGLLNKRKWNMKRRSWKDLSKPERLLLVVAVAVGLLLLALGIAVYLLVRKGF